MSRPCPDAPGEWLRRDGFGRRWIAVVEWFDRTEPPILSYRHGIDEPLVPVRDDGRWIAPVASAEEVTALRDALAGWPLALAEAVRGVTAERDALRAFHDETIASLDYGADEGAWPPGLTVPDAIRRLRARLAEVTAERDEARHLVSRALRVALSRLRRRRAAWAVVADLFAVGSTRAHGVCVAHGYDPDAEAAARAAGLLDGGEVPRAR